ncbi:glycerol-3-phosphate dehydrogenase/oxidase [Aeribacillus pallidus]|uniref:glycerol-3-phosphate dehydrogenase/oxidase n=1 Tax=Aeribacillus pallidus TaxID=33936 RepID=UPI003D1AA4AF
MKRQPFKERLQQERFDLIVIGGGITGAGIALDAATRGMKVALVEMQDFAAGTSSRSTKLVHGGLRYLKQFEVKMVAEVGKERAIVYENGPHVTTPEWMLLPIHEGGTFGKWSTSLGLFVYDYLAGVKKSERRKMLSREETIQKEPLLKKEGLKGGGYYVEYRTDDARLTIEVIKKAVEKGAVCVNYTKAEEFIYVNQQVKGIHVCDVLTGETYAIKGDVVVNAAGPWVDRVRNKDYSKNGKKLRLTKGIHLVIDQSVFPLKQAIYFDTPDGRMVFAIPRDGKTYVGTTDTFYDNNPAHPKMLAEDRAYVLNAIRYMFPSVNVTEQDVESSWAGVRPLIYEEGKDPSEISRKDEIWEGESGLITIAGGKLTGYRKMAETVVDLVAKRLEQQGRAPFPPCQTKRLPISGGEVGGSENLPHFIEQKGKEAIRYGLTEEEGKQLAKMYGSNVDHLFRIAQSYEGGTLPIMVYAQLKYALEEEMVCKPVDFFIRRTGALFFNIQWVHQWKQAVIDEMDVYFGWTQDEKQTYTDELEQELTDAVIPVDLQKTKVNR